MHANSELLFQAYAVPYIPPESRVLEIGPDSFPSTYQKIMPHTTRVWDTVDIYDSKNLTYPKAGEYAFPIPDDEYDVVISGQVIEHVKKIWCWIKEVERVCKKGGHVIIINPVSWPYHTHPVDCWRIFPDGMRALLEDTRLRVIDSRFESLEIPGYRRYIPGLSPLSQSWLRRTFFRMVGVFGFPVERAYDTVTIAQKE
jgi:ubiquinone/menaquinone biosynthesis C-methylase UbiE